VKSSWKVPVNWIKNPETRPWKQWDIFKKIDHKLSGEIQILAYNKYEELEKDWSV